jgi:hypothetical protein
MLAIELGQGLGRCKPAQDGREYDVIGRGMPPTLGQLDRERRPGPVPVAAVQVRASQAAGPAGADKRTDDAAVGAPGNDEVRHAPRVQAIPQVAVERLVARQHDEVRRATLPAGGGVAFRGGAADRGCRSRGIPKSLVIGQQAAWCGVLQRRVAFGLDRDLAHASSREERADHRQRPAGAAQRDDRRPASGHDLLGVSAMPYPQCGQVSGQARHGEGRCVATRADQEAGRRQRADG